MVPPRAVFVQRGNPIGLAQQALAGRRSAGDDDCVVFEDRWRTFLAASGIGDGPAAVHLRIAIPKLSRSAASFAIDGVNHFGFEGAAGGMFFSGPMFKGAETPDGPPPEDIRDGQPFDFAMVRRDGTITFTINGRETVRCADPGGTLGTLGLRPWRAVMRVYDFYAEGSLLPLTELRPLLPAEPKTFTVPVVDISKETQRHTIVAQGTEEVYQGHPTTVLMPDGRTIFCAWTYDHGGACGPLKRSDDAGRTWSELLPVPDNWSEVRNCPSLYHLTAPDGTDRLFVFAGGPRTMRQAWSEDGGAAWTPYRDLGIPCVMAFCGILPVREGREYLGLYHRNTVGGAELMQSRSADGGMTWSDPRSIATLRGASLCEPHMIRAPDGSRIACLIRENLRRYNSLLVMTEDEGETWTEPSELPASLTGDRHMACYAPDGRLVIAFRDMAAGSPTKSHFVAWVGTFDDIVAGREGQYRVKLLHSYRGSDCGYPGLERLPNGDLLATTYVQYRPGGEKNSVVSVRFRLDELDPRLDD